MDAVLQFLQENWQWLFALGCLAFYFYDKKKGNDTPDNKIEEIGAKAEEIIKEKVDEFVDDVEEEALDALEEKLDDAAEQALEKVVEVIAEAVKPPEPQKEPSPFSPANGYPDPSRTSKMRNCPCGSGKRYRGCHSQFWKPE